MAIKYRHMKLLHFPIIFLLLVSFSVFAQDEKKPIVPKFAIGVNFSPACAYRFIHLTDDGSNSVKSITKLMNESELPVFGYTAGLDFSWFASKRLTLETGLWFSDKGYQMKWMQFATIANPSNTDNKFKLYLKEGYLNIPLKLNFNIITSPLTFFISAGMSTDFRLYSKTKVFMVYEDGSKDTQTINYYEGMRDVIISYIGSFGLEYNFRKNFKIRFEPTYTMAILPLVTGELRTYLWTLGGNAGIYYMFR
jgi:hypothetical protein